MVFLFAKLPNPFVLIPMNADIKYIHVEELSSTSAVISTMDSECPEGGMLVLWADYQSAGRGQRGSRWVSQRGANLLFSVMLRPKNVRVVRQFLLSQAMAVAEANAINDMMREFGAGASQECKVGLKWPNDLYYGYKKLGGTIIETTLGAGYVERCVLGMGVNVNQTRFSEDAPDPVSLIQISGREWDREKLMRSIVERFSYLEREVEEEKDNGISEAYKDLLIWRSGLHEYEDKDGRFLARLVDILPDGHLLLRDTDGRLRQYMFKEVRHVFPNRVSE